MNVLRQLAVPFVGFGVGWAGWELLERSEAVTDDHHRQLATWRLQLMRCACLVAPSNLLGTKLEDVDSALDRLQGKMEQPPDNRVKFVEVLAQCRVQEQMEWMEEHAQEEIPFFFIADLFHAFAALHEGLLSTSDAVRDIPLINDARYASPILTRRTLDMMLTGVMPFDVASRVLAVLTVQNAGNRKLLAQAKTESGVTAAEAVLSKWEAYHTDLAAKGTPEGDAIVSSSSVDIATVQLLHALGFTHRSLLTPWRTTTADWVSAVDRGDLCRILSASASLPVGPSACAVMAQGARAAKCSLE